MNPNVMLALAGGAAVLLGLRLRKAKRAAVGLDITSALPTPDVFPQGLDVVWQDSKSTAMYSYSAQILALRAPDPDTAFVYALKGSNVAGVTADGWATTATRQEADAMLGELIAELSATTVA
jgi:hypothetical protein